MDLTPKPRDHIAPETHVFQNVREPRHPDVNAMCPRCGLALPNGPILALGPGGLPPCRPIYG